MPQEGDLWRDGVLSGVNDLHSLQSRIRQSAGARAKL